MCVAKDGRYSLLCNSFTIGHNGTSCGSFQGELGFDAAVIDGIVSDPGADIVGQALEDSVENQHGQRNDDAQDMLLPCETLRVK